MLVAVSGCGRSGETTKSKSGVDFDVVRAMGGWYDAYSVSHKNQPPKDEQAFRDYLNTRQTDLEKSGLTVDKMFVSPRSGEPLEWVYGKIGTVGPGSIAYIGYEKSPVDGKRLVIASRGINELVDDAQFHKLFPNAK
jgi:hypothetical protein